MVRRPRARLEDARRVEQMITASHAARVLKDVRLPGTVAAVEPISVGPVSSVFLIRMAAGESLVLKAFDRGHGWKATKEAHVYGLFAGPGTMPVPRVLGVFQDPYKLSPIGASLVVSMVQGVTLAEMSTRLADREAVHVYGALGSILRRSHDRLKTSGFGYVTTSVAGSINSGEDYARIWLRSSLRRFLRRGGDGSLAAEIRRFVAARRDALAGCVQPVLCHNDLNEKNIFVANYAGAWHISGIVDMEDAMAGDPIVDLARVHHLAVGRQRERWMALLDGYGNLPAGWADRFAAFRLLHAVDLWSWYRKLGWRSLLPSIESDIVQRCGCPRGQPQPLA